MPRYLRWIAAITTGITAQFVFFIIVGAIAIGTDNTNLGGGVGFMATLGSTFASLIPALAVNDWLARRYPAATSVPDMGAGLRPGEGRPGEGGLGEPDER